MRGKHKSLCMVSCVEVHVFSPHLSSLAVRMDPTDEDIQKAIQGCIRFLSTRLQRTASSAYFEQPRSSSDYLTLSTSLKTNALLLSALLNLSQVQLLYFYRLSFSIFDRVSKLNHRSLLHKKWPRCWRNGCFRLERTGSKESRKTKKIERTRARTRDFVAVGWALTITRMH